jgi:hypothetical protein
MTIKRKSRLVVAMLIAEILLDITIALAVAYALIF